MRFVLLVPVVTLLFSGVPLVAHHSFSAQYDENKTFKMTGPVTKIEWTNPHAYFYIDVADEKTKKVTNWTIEVGSINGLMRNGWTRNTVKTGDVVEVEGWLARDGTPLGHAVRVVMSATGKRILSGTRPPTN